MRIPSLFASCLPFQHDEQDNKSNQAARPGPQHIQHDAPVAPELGLPPSLSADNKSPQRPSVSVPSKPGYISTLQIVNDQSLGHELDKFSRKEYWTATRVEKGPFKLYQQQKRTGLILSEHTFCLVATKKDMGSDYIPKDPEYQNVRGYQGSDRNHHLAEQIKKTIEKAYEKERLEESDEEYVIRRPRVLTKKSEFDSKYTEMAARHEGSIADISSKFLLVDYLRKHVTGFDEKNLKSFGTYERELMGKLTSDERELMQNTVSKLNRQTPEEQVTYLSKGIEQREAARGKYSRELKQAFPHNEHLLIPDEKDVLGIFLHPKQVDAALMLQNQYKVRFNVSLPFMSYDERTGKASTLSQDEVENMSRGANIEVTK